MNLVKSKVVLLPCREYDEEKIYMLLKQGLNFLGGVETLIPKDAKILLKPNLLKKAEVEKAVITHPVVVGAFAGILRESGYENIVLADSCGHGTTQAVIRGTGMDTYLEKYHIPAVDYSEGVKTAYPQGVQAKEFILPKELLEQDCVISLSKMKTHALERITGAVKNSYGFVYGFHKAKGHTQYPSADSFARMLIDLNKCVAPKLYVMDGIVAMEGNGPGSGDPVPMNVLLMSTDPVALDSVFSRPEVRKNIWIRMAGALNIFQKKPYIEADKCVRCGICVQSCPVPGKAVDFRKGKGKSPVYDYRKCIRCFCCQEMCPKKAIKVK